MLPTAISNHMWISKTAWACFNLWESLSHPSVTLKPTVSLLPHPATPPSWERGKNRLLSHSSWAWIQALGAALEGQTHAAVRDRSGSRFLISLSQTFVTTHTQPPLKDTRINTVAQLHSTSPNYHQSYGSMCFWCQYAQSYDLTTGKFWVSVPTGEKTTWAKEAWIANLKTKFLSKTIQFLKSMIFCPTSWQPLTSCLRVMDEVRQSHGRRPEDSCRHVTASSH